MTRSSIDSQIVHAIAEFLKRDASTIQASHHLRNDLGLDSLAVVELLFKIEEAFDLRIPNSDLPALTTVGAVTAYVQEHVARPAAAVSQAKTSAGTPSRAGRK